MFHNSAVKQYRGRLGMDIRPLRYFIAVAEHLNFTVASKELFVAQPAVSQQIALLEKKLGVKLFLRDKHSVQLTNAGAVFLKDAKEIIKKLEESIECNITFASCDCMCSMGNMGNVR